MSNTHYLMDARGWRGMLVEATPDLCTPLAKARSRDVVVCGAICSESFGGSISFWSRRGHTATGHAEAMGANGRTSFAGLGTKTTVPCAPLGSLVDSAGLESVDLFSLDVEQQELNVLQTLNLTSFRFGVLIIELQCPGKQNELSRQDPQVRTLRYPIHYRSTTDPLPILVPFFARTYLLHTDD